MEARINLFEKGQAALKAMYGLSSYLAKSRIEQALLHLIYFRVSQINGCAFCLDMHSKDARAAGETEQRLYLLNAWRESPMFTDRERAAFAWAEAVTRIAGGDVPQAIYEQVREEFSEDEIVDLTLAVMAINSYNRMNIAFRTPAGGYEVGAFATK